MPAVEVIAGGACKIGFVSNWKNPIFGALSPYGLWFARLPSNQSAQRISLFRQMNSLFATKISLFRADQGIRPQRIEVARKLPVLHGTEDSRQHTEITSEIGAGRR